MGLISSERTSVGLWVDDYCVIASEEPIMKGKGLKQLEGLDAGKTL